MVGRRRRHGGNDDVVLTKLSHSLHIKQLAMHIKVFYLSFFHAVKVNQLLNGLLLPHAFVPK